MRLRVGCAVVVLAIAQLARADDAYPLPATHVPTRQMTWHYMHGGAASFGLGLLRSIAPRSEASAPWSSRSDNLCLPAAFVRFDARGDLFPAGTRWSGLQLEAAQVRWARGVEFHVLGELEPYDGHAMELEPGLTFAFQYRFR